MRVEAALNGERGAHSVGVEIERSHHCVSDCLHDRAFVLTDFVAHELEVLLHERVRGSVAEGFVHLGGAPDVGEHQGDRAHREGHTWREELAGEEVSKILLARDVRG
jgi:hypothetical protein